MNLIVGYGLQYLYDSNNLEVILYLGAFLMSVMIFRIILSFIHRIKARIDKSKVASWIKGRKSTVFANVNQTPAIDSSDEFSIYYDEENNEMKIGPSSKKIASFPLNTLAIKSSHDRRKSSVKDVNVYRGFNFALIQELHSMNKLGQSIKDVPPSKFTPYILTASPLRRKIDPKDLW